MLLCMCVTVCVCVWGVLLLKLVATAVLFGYNGRVSSLDRLFFVVDIALFNWHVSMFACSWLCVGQNKPY